MSYCSVVYHGWTNEEAREVLPKVKPSVGGNSAHFATVEVGPGCDLYLTRTQCVQLRDMLTAILGQADSPLHGAAPELQRMCERAWEYLLKDEKSWELRAQLRAALEKAEGR